MEAEGGSTRYRSERSEGDGREGRRGISYAVGRGKGRGGQGACQSNCCHRCISPNGGGGGEYGC